MIESFEFINSIYCVDFLTLGLRIHHRALFVVLRFNLSGQSPNKIRKESPSWRVWYFDYSQ